MYRQLRSKKLNNYSLLLPPKNDSPQVVFFCCYNRTNVHIKKTITWYWKTITSVNLLSEERSFSAPSIDVLIVVIRHLDRKIRSFAGGTVYCLCCYHCTIVHVKKIITWYWKTITSVNLLSEERSFSAPSTELLIVVVRHLDRKRRLSTVCRLSHCPYNNCLLFLHNE